ncbi:MULTISPECIES: amino acid ABC transporter ATP-binding protein [Cryobacterium]|uniref:Amino acid ABC transporter ATP-binding protein n=1 Tax=Cryobacterium glucosi TaxID=1259175 RepID=A0ABY2IRD4_9MICO|nr:MULTISPECIES: amino acid ABC transporter ATP-binding protein [Cryobacterium]MDY7528609.1 amino acid ABC transporter ATP-binding protein [Cryobacterium sp. 10C2]MDY7555653.1 amino acid ABC transporter ATP-binding protein [Cryobacterium sp. 10C3]MEB0003672.1 amino acid ABC transporter ATP-binding protein [Cryobacterium sp. RTC2.1]MEB0201504.1 amino acid ABC transporter ATP-binding protein [Cryobacterium sp. 5I3]MEB0285779.1 amino acid ABC transporter ATP-binding protein [Cryobacterium sp. 10S
MSPIDTPLDPPTEPQHGEGTEPAASAALLTVRGLRKSFGSTSVLESIDLTVARGQVLALIGPSGSGKTTILRCLNGLETADGGTITITAEVADATQVAATPGDPSLAGTAITVDFGAVKGPSDKSLAALRDRSAMVFQNYNLFPHKTVLENVLEGPVVVQRRPKAEVTAEALALLARVGLADKTDAFPFELSGGQQQRVGIVRALALRPQLLLFDEPTSSLDPELVGDVLRLIKELAIEGWTMVIVTHELEFAREVASEIAFVDGGTIVEHGDPRQVLRNPREERTRQFLHRLLNPF